MISEDLASLATPVADLNLLPGNPRRGDIDAIAASLARFGQRKPIVVRRSDSVVIAGNHTLQAAQHLGWDDVAAVWVDDDEATAKAYSLADNRTAELGGYDEAELAELIGQVQAADAELLAATGWTDDDLKALLEKIAAEEPPESKTDPDEVPDPPVDPISKRGDVWVLGKHLLVCGDSTKPGPWEALLGGVKVDLVWTDPPYGVSYVGKTAQALTIQNDDARGLEEILRAMFAIALASSNPGACWYVAGPAGPLHLLFGRLLLEIGVLHQTLIWVKDQFVMGRSDFHYRHEPVYYGWSPGAAHRRPPDRKQDTVFEVPRPKASQVHPTMKPVELVERQIRNSTIRGALVVDPFAGSGSTLIACHRAGRLARLIELDPCYSDVICRRFQEHTGITPVRDGAPHDFLRAERLPESR